MATTEYKKVWNFFFISQVDEEEQWINSMARAGWDFVRVNWCSRYIFKRGIPGQYIYKIDLPENLPHGLGKEEYYNFLTECGIRIVHEKKEWMYLQKRASDGPFNREGDMFAKLKSANKSYSYAIRTLCTLLKIFSAILIVVLLAQMVTTNPSVSNFLMGITMGIGIGTTLSVTFIWVPIITSLRKRINSLIDEIGIKN
ncbi:MAG: DUF2812 domain-containing protein [Alistipes sp.]|nr:DUF2812 domain-containing protein [Alistipes sp.]